VEYVLIVRKEWRQATDGLSIGAKGLLTTLLERAAAQRCTEIAISLATLTPHLDCPRGRESFAAWLAELKLRRLVRERPLGKFAIAPGLWTVAIFEFPRSPTPTLVTLATHPD
jgi:hypothetical protein